MKSPITFLMILFSFSIIGCGDLLGKKKGKKTAPPSLTMPSPTKSSSTMIEKSDVSSYLTTPRNDDATTVMVIDNNFDYEHEVFRNKIVAAYTIVCDEDSTSYNNDEFYYAIKNTPQEELKASLIASYKIPDESCRLEQGIKFRYLKEDFDTIANFRQEWNNFMLGKTSYIYMSQDSFTQTAAALERPEPGYHGTSTAGLIARDNDNVNLVLVNMNLHSSKDSIEMSMTCKTAEMIATINKLMADDEVKQAAIHQPISREERDLNRIIDLHNVRIINKSYGALSANTIESFFDKNGCGDKIVSTNFQINGAINTERATILRNKLPESSPAKKVLTIEASGNENEEINSHADSLSCPDKNDKNTLLVGSSDYSYYSSSQRSEFSNYGECVKYHVLGHQVIAPTGLGFYTVVSGTSFSAPLLVRYITLKTETSSSNEEIIAFLDSKADKDGFIERDEDMTELSWDHRKETELPILASAQRTSNLINVQRISKLAKMPNLGR